jgi:hypothetical protein
MRLLSAITLLALAGCATTSVVPVTNEPLTSVCIIHNPDVNVDDFVAVVQERFAYHGIKSRLVEASPAPAACPYTLDYTADRWWDLAPYMVDAKLFLKKNGEVIASGHFHIKAHGGFDVTKWKGTEAKLDPVIDEMLAAYHRS